MTVEQQFESMIEEWVSSAIEGGSEDEIQRLADAGLVGQAIAESAPEIANVIADSLIESAPGMLAERRGDEALAEEEIRRGYGDGLDLCEMILRCAHEMGGEYVDRHFSPGEIPILRWVLGHLHARACRIAEEALLLLRAGYPLGAYARWRALHEVVVVGAFIQQHGDDMALRYFEHLTVERWSLLKASAEVGQLSGEEEAALAQAQSEVDQLTARFGPAFAGDYGWAADAIKGSAHRRFRAIEEAADFSHLRLNYQDASASIHASPGLALQPPGSEYRGSTVQAGPSGFGIVTPRARRRAVAHGVHKHPPHLD